VAAGEVMSSGGRQHSSATNTTNLAGYSSSGLERQLPLAATATHAITTVRVTPLTPCSAHGAALGLVAMVANAHTRHANTWWR